MNYQVLSRKYRPQKFEDIVGQSHISATLRNAIKGQRVSHAYLFSGSRGIGKTSTARIFAKTLNCLNPVDFNPCNECQNCREITAGNSMDVLEIDGASNRGIGEIRELRENVKYPPATSQYRIYIIDEVHMLTKEAFNALLKTLEEPPRHVIFIFATTEPHKIPETIISRCQRFDFHRIPVSEIVEMLQHIAENENVKVPVELLMMIAKKANGGMRDSESLLDQIISFSGDEVDMETAIRVLGLIDYDFLFRIGDMILEHDRYGLMKSATDVFDKGIETGEFFAGLAEHFRNLLVAGGAGTTEMLDLPNDVKKRYENESSRWEAGDLLRLISMLYDAKLKLQFAFNQRSHLEFTLLKMGGMEKTVTIQEILAQLGNPSAPVAAFSPAIKKKSELAPPSPATAKPAVSQPKPAAPVKTEAVSDRPEPVKARGNVTVTLDDIKARWHEVSEDLGKSRNTLSSFLEFGEPVKLTDNLLEIAYHSKMAFQMNNITKNCNAVEKSLQTILGVPIKIRCKVDDKIDKAGVDTSKLDELSDYVTRTFNGIKIV